MVHSGRSLTGRKPNWNNDFNPGKNKANQNNIIDSSVIKVESPDYWEWNEDDKSPDVHLDIDNPRVARFHPNWSSGTAGVRGSRVLDGRRYYWELLLPQRLFGTSVMFGVATKAARLHANTFTNLLGEDAHGWGLSHKGLLWHEGRWSKYTRPFTENQTTTIGLLFDGVAGTLTYYKDNECLGVAFRDLNRCQMNLYPFICSTASKVLISLSETRKDFIHLKERCREVVAQYVKSKERMKSLGLPRELFTYLEQAVPSTTPRIFQDASLNTILDM